MPLEAVNFYSLVCVMSHFELAVESFALFLKKAW